MKQLHTGFACFSLVALASTLLVGTNVHADSYSNNTVIEYGRVIERLLIVTFGGLSLVLGWNLFRASIFKSQEAEFSTGSVKIKLIRVGPGVFFALFGAAILCISVVNTYSFSSVHRHGGQHHHEGSGTGLESHTDRVGEQMRDGKTEPGEVGRRGRAHFGSVLESTTKGSYYGGDADLTSADIMQAINSVIAIDTHLNNEVDPVRRQEVLMKAHVRRLSMAANHLKSLRDQWVAHEFQEEIQAYWQIRDKDPTQLSREERGIREELDQYLEQQLP